MLIAHIRIGRIYSRDDGEQESKKYKIDQKVRKNNRAGAIYHPFQVVDLS